MRPNKAYLSRPALSMVETTMSILIVGTLLASTFSAAGVAARRSLTSTRQIQATWLAHDLLSEIAAQPCEADSTGLVTGLVNDLSSIVSKPGASRAAFSNIFDYNNWASKPPVDPDGTPIDGYSGWVRTASVQGVNPLTLAPRSGDDSAALITVTVVSPEGIRTSVSAVRTSSTDTLRSVQPGGNGGDDGGGIIRNILEGLL